METEEQLKQYKNSAAESFASLSFGLWTVSLIGYLSSGISWTTYFLVVVGAISALFSTYLSIYLVLPWDWKQKSVLKYLETNQTIKVTKFLVWLIILTAFAVMLVQTKVGWLIATGLIIIIIAFISFYVGLWKTGKDYGRIKRFKEVKSMGTKGRKNVKKPKLTKEQKEQKKKK